MQTLPLWLRHKNRSNKKKMKDFKSLIKAGIPNDLPIKKELKGMHEYYIPEGTYNSFNYEKGKWILYEDIDARNKQINTKTVKPPKMGLIK